MYRCEAVLRGHWNRSIAALSRQWKPTSLSVWSVVWSVTFFVSLFGTSFHFSFLRVFFFHRMIDQHLVRPRQMCVLFHWSLEFRRALHLRIKYISQLEVLLLVFHLLKRSWFQRLKFFCVSRRKPRKWNHFFNISQPFCKHSVLPLVSRTRCHGNFITQDTLVWRQVQDEHWGFS